MIRELTRNLDIVSGLENEPNDEGGMSAAELKAKFDESGNAIKSYINGTLIPDVTEEITREVEAAQLASGNMPRGGKAGQLLAKGSDSDYDYKFTDPAESAVSLKTPRAVKINLASSTAAEFDGTADILPGVTGILPVENGGTGASGREAAALGLGRGLGTCETAAATVNKTATCSGFVRSRGAVAGVTFTYPSTAASPTLNINGTGAAAIIDSVTGAAVAKGKMTGKTHFFQFNGTSWILLNPTEWKIASGEVTGFGSGTTSVSVTLGFTPSAVIAQLHSYETLYTATFAGLVLGASKTCYMRNASSYNTASIVPTATGFQFNAATTVDASTILRYVALA